MNLQRIAEDDLTHILESESDCEILLTSPAGVTNAVKGVQNDISTVIDPETGMSVKGRLIGVALRISSVLATFGELPCKVAKKTSKPWRVTFTNLQDEEKTYYVTDANPDRSLGVITLELDFYND